MFERVKKYYDRGFYTEAQVADFVKKGKLTAEQYKEITNEDYEG